MIVVPVGRRAISSRRIISTNERHSIINARVVGHRRTRMAIVPVIVTGIVVAISLAVNVEDIALMYRRRQPVVPAV